MSTSITANPLLDHSAKVVNQFVRAGWLPAGQAVHIAGGQTASGFELTDKVPDFKNVTLRLAQNPTYSPTTGAGRVAATASALNHVMDGPPDPGRVVGTTGACNQISPTGTDAMTVTETSPGGYFIAAGHPDKATNLAFEQTLTREGDSAQWNIAAGPTGVSGSYSGGGAETTLALSLLSQESGRAPNRDHVRMLALSAAFGCKDLTPTRLQADTIFYTAGPDDQVGKGFVNASGLLDHDSDVGRDRD